MSKNQKGLEELSEEAQEIIAQMLRLQNAYQSYNGALVLEMQNGNLTASECQEKQGKIMANVRSILASVGGIKTTADGQKFIWLVDRYIQDPLFED